MITKFRQAKPEDVREAVPLIFSAAPEAFTYLLSVGRANPLEFLTFSFREGGGFFGCHNHTVAITHDQIAGIGSFYSGKEYHRLGLEYSKQVFKFYGLINGLKVLRRGLQIKKLIPPPDKVTEYIANLGVKEELRGMGIGTKLLEHQKEVACLKKKKMYALDVATNNPLAQKLYERLGFQVIQEREFVVKGIIPHVKRMEMALKDK